MTNYYIQLISNILLLTVEMVDVTFIYIYIKFIKYIFIKLRYFLSNKFIFNLIDNSV